MTTAAVHEALAAAETSLRRALGGGLEAFIVGDAANPRAARDVDWQANLLIVLAAPELLHAVREVLAPQWPQLVAALQEPPLVGSHHAIERHLRLFPLLAESLSPNLQAELALAFASPAVGERERLAWDLATALRASAALAPTLLTATEAGVALADLRLLVRRLTGQPGPPDAPPAELYATLQAGLAARVRHCDDLPLPAGEMQPPPAVMDALVAIYETESQLILVLDDLPPELLAERIRTTDWSDVAERIAGEYRGLGITTGRQLQLILSHERAADLVVRRFRRAWGLDFLTSLAPAPDAVLRDLARLPSTLEVALLPGHYIARSDADLPELVHDSHNRLLNVQLRDELYGRYSGTPPTRPDRPLPGRDAGPAERIEGILDHLEWWAEHYAAQLSS